MLQIFIASLYISWICWIWGYSLIRIFTKLVNHEERSLPSLVIVCLTGLSVIAVLSGLVSLFLPLGGIAAQLIILIPAVSLFAANKVSRSGFIAAINKTIVVYTPVTTVLVICLIVLLLMLGASEINHPDSIGYHIQTIKWISEYKAIPGLVHLNTQLGYQGLWFCLCSLFSFNFLHTTSVTFINTTVLIWYLLFLINEINLCLNKTQSINPKKDVAGILYFILLAFSCWSYGQLRLTATSLSPDFIATLYVWLIFYLLFAGGNKSKSPVLLMLIFFLCTVAITIKLSSVPVFMILLYALYQLKKLKKYTAVLLLLVLAFITLSPFIARNIITSGYVVFPSVFPDIITADWKLSTAATIKEKQYITSFARQEHQIIKPPAPGEYRNQFLPAWLPTWWQLRSFSDKVILSSLFFILLLAIVSARKIWNEGDAVTIFSIMVSLPALAFWFYQAPDPRFGFGFIIPVQGILIYFFAIRHVTKLKAVKNWLTNCLLAFTCIIIAYGAYRGSNYFSTANILKPAGALKVNYITIKCGSTDIHFPIKRGCSNIPLPCVYYNDCNHFATRGNLITDGFKAR